MSRNPKKRSLNAKSRANHAGRSDTPRSTKTNWTNKKIKRDIKLDKTPAMDDWQAEYDEMSSEIDEDIARNKNPLYDAEKEIEAKIDKRKNPLRISSGESHHDRESLRRNKRGQGTNRPNGGEVPSGGNNNKGGNNNPIVINNNFHPPAPAPPNNAPPAVEAGVVYDLPHSVYIHEINSTQSKMFQVACSATMLFMLYTRAFNPMWYADMIINAPTSKWAAIKMYATWVIKINVIVAGAIGKLSEIFFQKIETNLVRTGRMIDCNQRHMQNRSVVPTATKVLEYEYQHNYKPVNWLQQKMSDFSNWIRAAMRPAPQQQMTTTGIIKTLVNYYVVTPVMNKLFDHEVSYLMMPDELSKYHEVGGKAKTEIVSEELYQSTLTTRTTNGHMDQSRLFTNIEQHVMNRTDTVLTTADSNNENSVATSTITVVKYVAKNNVEKARSLGFYPGLSKSNINSVTDTLNSPTAGGQTNQSESSLTSGAKYRHLSENDYSRDAQFRGLSVLKFGGLAVLTLTLVTLWGRLLERLNDPQLSFHSMLLEFSQWEVG